MNVIECEQGSGDWMAARRGKVTASRIKDVMDFTAKGVSGAKREAYKLEILSEILTGSAEDHFVTKDMQWGTDNEPFARAAYEVQTDNDVRQVGFVLHPTISKSGASPDGLIREDGSLEIKCPKTTTFLKWRFAGVAPDEHKDQMLWVMDCCDRKWCDFVAFDPRLPEPIQLWIIRFDRDEARIKALRYAVRQFLQEVDAMYSKIMSC